uniref:Uncharacterized protein n=1 Tax=Sphaerodactylus townsendi TaxID=933632 RepID=A0ACB8G486_9SAUR
MGLPYRLSSMSSLLLGNEGLSPCIASTGSPSFLQHFTNQLCSEVLRNNTAKSEQLLCGWVNSYVLVNMAVVFPVPTAAPFSLAIEGDAFNCSFLLAKECYYSDITL